MMPIPTGCFNFNRSFSAWYRRSRASFFQDTMFWAFRIPLRLKAFPHRIVVITHVGSQRVVSSEFCSTPCYSTRKIVFAEHHCRHTTYLSSVPL